MKTWNPKPGEVKQKWHIVDAKGKVLGRIATEIASLLRGKRKPQFAPHVDTGDFVVVINAKDVAMTGNKWVDKKYYSHSRYFGSTKTLSAQQLQETHPERLVEFAVQGMLPKTRLGKKLFTKLKVYAGADHPHAAQKPEAYSI